MANACLEQGALIISDEIHAELCFDGRRHIPTASLSPEIAQRTITLMSASKAYNVAGLKTCFAVVQNAEMRERFNQARCGMVDSVSPWAWKPPARPTANAATGSRRCCSTCRPTATTCSTR